MGAVGVLLVIAWVVLLMLRSNEKEKRARAQTASRIASSNRQLGVTSASGSNVTRIGPLNYLGGHPLRQAPEAGVSLALAPGRVGVERITAGGLLFSVNLSEISAVEVETQEEVQQRVTATRLLVAGVFAFAWKKRTGGSIIVTLETPRGPLMFEQANRSKAAVLASLAPLRSKLGGSKPAVAAPAQGSTGQTTAQRLQKVDELLRSNAISADEHRAQRERILRDI